ncbi:RNA 2'-phosphotransferase [Paenibacillus sp. YN15]|uniref:RNA 2'-phosphotransferase n=1 Tax=Paenibacillus sp. YN15 TaxID=1742774 RepID=UPI000DCC2166|nr:RNA 2'-phosphotransferase [Paenibacillus sp. YN15]RAU98877.1 RNA 2'-phosphotransferase [Paenibacillus sp. YN15]
MLKPTQEKTLSKWMTKALRHTPGEFGLTLDPEDGSCPADSLLAAITSHSRWSWVTLEHIRQVVRNSDKQRFEWKGERIRARYGHSHDHISYTPEIPPAVLYHGTNQKALPSILKEGLLPMGRQYVHLSEGTHFATMAGSRRGELVILRVDTAHARESGATFYYAGNEVWLADRVPAASCSIDQHAEGRHPNHE